MPGLTNTIPAHRFEAVRLRLQVRLLLLRQFFYFLKLAFILVIELDQLQKLGNFRHFLVIVSTICELLTNFDQDLPDFKMVVHLLTLGLEIMLHIVINKIFYILRLNRIRHHQF